MKYLIILLLALALGGCASSKSIPTSSDANVSAEVVTAKGGTMACAVGGRIVLDPATGYVTAFDCQTNLAFTDPPSPEETTALSKFGEQILSVFAIPFRVLAAMGGALTP